MKEIEIKTKRMTLSPMADGEIETLMASIESLIDRVLLSAGLVA